jgi:hypothetical protein
MVMRYDSSPDDPYIKSFIEHRPDPRNELLCRLWKRDIKELCEMAVNVIHLEGEPGTAPASVRPGVRAATCQEIPKIVSG